MTSRISRERTYALQPELPAALKSMMAAVEKSGLDPKLLELIKLRASQLNGCVFCLWMHAAAARKLGERQERLDLLPAWREAECFDARERAALAWTDALTLVAADQAPDEAYAIVASQFGEEEIVNLTTAIVAINGWNRVAIGLRFAPPVR
jgi:AhpD family alkylhydroperoxidase